MDFLLIILLVVLNGLFSMSEMAVVSSRKSRLQSMADEGRLSAKAALQLHEEPSRFLSTIQIGITSIGILSGAIGERAFMNPLVDWIRTSPDLAPYAGGIAMTITVAGITYFSVVVGELIPKQLALWAPEWIASVMAAPMKMFARIAHPFVVLLSGTSTVLLRLTGLRKKTEPPITDNEIKVLMEEGAKAGIFHESEQELVSNVLRLDVQRVHTIMTARPDMVSIDLDEGEETVRMGIIESGFSRLIVCRGGLDNIVGVLKTNKLMRNALLGKPIGLAEVEQALVQPLYIPESVTTSQLLERFRTTGLQFALVVDEFGDVQGLVTLTDILAAIVGEHNIPYIYEEKDIVRREDGSWLVEGSVSLDKLRHVLEVEETWPEDDEQNFHTLGGFIMATLGRIPVSAEYFEAYGLRFEVVDMDKNRVDKVLITKL